MPANRSSFPPARQSVLHLVKKKQKQEPSRFLPCPVCHRSFPSHLIRDLCLDSPATQSSSSPTFPPHSSSQGLPLSGKDYDQVSLSAVSVEKDANLEDSLKSLSAEQDCTKSLLTFATVLPSNGSLRDNNEIPVVNGSSYEDVEERDGDAGTPKDEAYSFFQRIQDCPPRSSVLTVCDVVESPEATGIVVAEMPQVEEMEREAQDDMGMTSPEKEFSHKPGHGLQIFQRQSQAKLSMLCKFPMSSALERKPTATVLQPGMVLLRSWLSMDVLQRLVNVSQSAAHFFKRPTTAGGGKYHLWQMAFGCQWDSKTRLYAAQTRASGFQPGCMILEKSLRLMRPIILMSILLVQTLLLM